MISWSSTLNDGIERRRAAGAPGTRPNRDRRATTRDRTTTVRDRGPPRPAQLCSQEDLAELLTITEQLRAEAFAEEEDQEL